MTDAHEDPVNLMLVSEDAELRASRVVAGVMDRVAAERRSEAALWENVRRQLARFAMPAALAAAAGLTVVLLTDTTPPPPNPDPFAPAVLAGNPAMGWIAMDRRPDISEVLAMLRGGQ